MNVPQETRFLKTKRHERGAAPVGPVRPERRNSSNPRRLRDRRISTVARSAYKQDNASARLCSDNNSIVDDYRTGLKKISTELFPATPRRGFPASAHRRRGRPRGAAS